MAKNQQLAQDSMVIVKLSMMCQGAILVEAKETETRVFTSMDKATQWLMDNGFSYGQRLFFSYKNDQKEWIHKNDESWHFIDVEICEYKINDCSGSKFRDFKVNPCPWR